MSSFYDKFYFISSLFDICLLDVVFSVHENSFWNTLPGVDLWEVMGGDSSFVIG